MKAVLALALSAEGRAMAVPKQLNLATFLLSGECGPCMRLQAALQGGSDGERLFLSDEASHTE